MIPLIPLPYNVHELPGNPNIIMKVEALQADWQTTVVLINESFGNTFTT